MPTHTYSRALLFIIAALAAVPAGAAAQDSAPGAAHPSVTMFRGGFDWRPLIAPGQTVTLSIGVTNPEGTKEVPNAVLTVFLPPGLTLKQARPIPDQNVAPADTPSWKLGTVSAGAFPRLFDLDLQATLDAKEESRLGVVAVVSTADQEPGDQGAGAKYVFGVAKAAANLVLESNLVAVPFTADSPVEFTVTVTNLGTVPASACVLKMTVPRRATFKGSDPAPADKSGSVISWPIGDIAPADSRSVNVKVALDQILRVAAYGFAPKLGSLRFKFDATTTTDVFDVSNGHLEIDRYAEPAGSNVSVSLNVPDAEHPGELPVGKDATFQVIYGNYGSAPASEVIVSLELPKGLDLVNAIPAVARSNQGDTAGSGVSFWDLGDLGVGDSGIITAHIHVTSIGSDGSMVRAVISAKGNDVPSSEKTVYSLQRAANSHLNVAGAKPGNEEPGHTEPRSGDAEPRGGHALWWLLPIAVIASLVVWAVRRARSKRAT